jgi:hypothetical protein
MLVRPDCHVAWAATETGPAALDDLHRALATWFVPDRIDAA